jgi:biotin-(acetyl-CoA carboxylase) ligase
MNINQTEFSPEALNSVSSNPISLQEITNQSWDVKKMQQHLSEALNNAIQDWLQFGEEATLKTLEQHIIELDQL